MIEFENPKVTINEKTYEAELATIESTHLGYEDHGIGTAVLHFAGPGWAQSNSAPVLSQRGEDGVQHGNTLGFEFILRILDCVGCSIWESLVNSKVYVLRTGPYRSIEGILSVDQERHFIFSDVVTREQK